MMSGSPCRFVGVHPAAVPRASRDLGALRDWRLDETASTSVLGLFITVGLVLVAARMTNLSRTFRAEVARALERVRATSFITEQDLAALPEPVARYLRARGAVGQVRVRNFHARFHGEIRGGPNDAWILFTGEQYNFYDEPARFFFMRAKRGGLPVHVLHRYVGGRATMAVRLAGLFTVVNASGPEMDQAETVTLFNDMCVLAPATLVDAQVEWQQISSDQVRGDFTNAGHRVSAILTFDEQDQLIDFVSDDRYQLRRKGRFERVRWSTPIESRPPVGPHPVSVGEAWWHAQQGPFPYIRFTVDTIAYNTGFLPSRVYSERVMTASKDCVRSENG